MAENSTMYKDVESKWQALCDLCLTGDGRIVTTAQWKEEQERRKWRQIQEKRFNEEQESKQSWEKLELETLNSLLIQYKHDGNPLYFNMAWHRYLNKLTKQYLHKYVIQGLPLVVKRLYMADHHAEELQDMLYPILIKAIQQWSPNVPDRNTLDFAAYYGEAIEYFTGNIVRKYKRRRYENLSLQHLDFYNEEQINLLLQGEPNVAERLGNHSGIEEWMLKQHVEEFIQDCLTEEQRILLLLIYDEQMPVIEIANRLKCSRMTVHRKRKQIEDLWKQYELGHKRRLKIIENSAGFVLR